MKTMTLSLVLLLGPAALGAQAGGQAQSTGSTSTKARGPVASMNATANANAEFRAPRGFSAEGAAKLEAMYAEAHEHQVPREPMAHRVAEGRAKGASEAAILASVGKVKANMESTHEAMVAAGREHPSDAETERGASAMERGVTRVQLETLVKHTPSDRSLVVAFDVLTKLAARGVPVTQALAQVQAKIDGRASDAAITSLVTVGRGSATGTAAGSAATAPKGAAVGVTGTVTGAVGGVTKRP